MWYFCVKDGWIPGVYDDRDEALAQIVRYDDPECAVFDDIDDAVRYMDGSLRAHTNLTARDLHFYAENMRPANAKYYAVANGRRRGIYHTWEECRAQVDGFPQATYKSFKSFLDAYDWYVTTKRPSVGARGPYGADAGLVAGRVPGPVAGGVRSPPLVVYTDGCSLNNGRTGALAGVGVYYGPGDPRNLACPLLNGKQTNQRAELTAVLKALERCPVHQDLVIRTDSKYSISCVEEWSSKWLRNGWTNAKGQPVENAELVRLILSKIELKRNAGARLKLEYVAGHSGDIGNDGADRLANIGALKPR